jgi:protein-tyrosine-phosphatase
VPVEGLSSKSWDRFTDEEAPPLDIVITVCDNAANETCPVLFGDFVKSHWGSPDPAAANGEDALIEAFRQAHALIISRVTALLDLPLETMSRDELRHALDHIGTLTEGRAASA